MVAARYDIHINKGTDWERTFTLLDAADDPIDVSAAPTKTVSLYDYKTRNIIASPAITLAVGGADSNVVTISQTDAVSVLLTEPVYAWVLIIEETAGKKKHWVAGELHNHPPGFGFGAGGQHPPITRELPMASESITIRAAALPDTAASVGVTDTAGHFVGTNVETVLAELADGTTLDGRYANATGDTFTGDVTVSKATPILRSTATTGNAHLILDATLGSYSIVQFFENGVQISYLIQRTGTGSFDLVKNGVVLKLLDDSEQFDASNAAAVIVPPASAATHAARVTAFDAALSPGTNGAAVEGSDATRDTGWRDMTVNASVVSSGNVHLRRVGDLVTWGLLCSTTGTGALLDATAHPNIPVGFRCKNRASIQVTDSGFTATTGIVGVATFTVPTLGARTAAGCYGTLSYTTTDAWPTSLPGVAA